MCQKKTSTSKQNLILILNLLVCCLQISKCRYHILRYFNEGAVTSFFTGSRGAFDMLFTW